MRTRISRVTPTVNMGTSRSACKYCHMTVLTVRGHPFRMFERRSTDSTEHVYYLRQYLVSLFSGQGYLSGQVATGFIRKYRNSLKVNLKLPNQTHAPRIELGVTQGTPRGGVLCCAPQLRYIISGKLEAPDNLDGRDRQYTTWFSRQGY